MNIVVAFSLGIVGSVLYSYIASAKMEILALCLLNLILATAIVLSFRIIRYLSYRVARPAMLTSRDIKEVLVSEVVDSLIRYGYIKNTDKERQVREVLAPSNYIRGQNIYYMMNHGIISVKKRVLFINDHPFKPFSDLINQNIPEGTEYAGIGALPDDLYPKEDILRRLEIIQRYAMEYFFLPDDDVHLSMVIFDDTAAVLYSTPAGRTVCNFSEGLLITDKEAVREMVKVFDHIFAMAKRRYKGDMQKVKDDLLNISTFYKGPVH